MTTPVRPSGGAQRPFREVWRRLRTAVSRRVKRADARVTPSLTRVAGFIPPIGSRGRRSLAVSLFTLFRREERSWQDRLLAAGDPRAFLAALDRRAEWRETLLLRDWPVFPVVIHGLRAWLIVGREIAPGFPLRAVYFPDADQLVRPDEKESDHVGRIVEALRQHPFPRRANPGLAGLVVGHNNFAHVFMGTLNALHRGTRIHGFASATRVHPYLQATMGDYTEPELFPDLSGKLVPIDAFVDPDGSYPDVLVPIGVGPETISPFRVETDLRLAVRDLADRIRTPASEPFRVRMDAAEFVLWMSVRVAGNRTMLNFNDWVRATLAALERRGVRPLVVFDGLSIQPTYDSDSILRSEHSGDQIRREASLVDDIMAGSDLDYAYVGGLPLYDAFYLSRFASFYACHSGSLDHKVKFVNPDLPGIVHANRQRARDGFAYDPTLDRVRAPYIPVQFIRDEKPPGFEDRPVKYALYPYWVEPVSDAAEWVTDQIMSTVRRAADG